MALNKVSRTLRSLLWKLQESFEQFIHIKKTFQVTADEENTVFFCRYVKWVLFVKGRRGRR